MDKKRIFIYENVYKMNDHTNLINLINSFECKYTQNSNGMFINLNTLEDNIIDNIYFLVHNEINSEIDEHIYNHVISEDIQKPEKVIIVDNTHKDFFLDDFNEEDKEIIIKSKLYKL